MIEIDKRDFYGKTFVIGKNEENGMIGVVQGEEEVIPFMFDRIEFHMSEPKLYTYHDKMSTGVLQIFEDKTRFSALEFEMKIERHGY